MQRRWTPCGDGVEALWMGVIGRYSTPTRGNQPTVPRPVLVITLTEELTHLSEHRHVWAILVDRAWFPRGLPGRGCP